MGYIDNPFFYSIFLFLAYKFMGDDWLKFKVGDLVSRISHNHDIVFRIISIDQQNVFLKGVDLRLYADADIDDLTIVNNVLNMIWRLYV